MDIEDKLRESILRRPVANGLAIIIANENSSNPSHQPLRSARKDLENMKDTFEVLRFATLPILNASKEQVLAAIRAAAKYKNYPPCYKRIAFAFSGHGDQNVIYAHDGPIETNQLYDPLQPLNAPHLAHIPKLFFMDACRGPNEDRGVEVVARGKTEPPRNRIPVPSYGNYVLAFSTMPSMKAYELKDVGGVWMNKVSKELRTNRKSILDVLTEVNGKLLNEFRLSGFEFYQQPVLESALNEPFGLLEEAEELGNWLYLWKLLYAHIRECLLTTCQASGNAELRNPGTEVRSTAAYLSSSDSRLYLVAKGRLSTSNVRASYYDLRCQ